MYKFTKILGVLLLSAYIGRSQALIDPKGTIIPIDTSKWKWSGTDIYNKNAGTVGIGTNGAANSNAALEVQATNKGMLIPRIALTATDNTAPLSAHVAGMMVYNTATAGTAPNNVTPGFYYSDGSKWIKVANAATVAKADTTNDSWKDDAANKRVYLQYKADGTTARPSDSTVVIKDNGYTGIGLTSPAGILDIKGRMYVNNKQTIYHADALNPNFAGSLFVGNGGTNLTYNGTFGEGSFNTGMGIDVLTANTTGGRNTATGYEALNFNTTGQGNSAYGNEALSKNTTGSNNVAVGNISLGVNETGTGNTAVGVLTFPQLESGVNNTVIGNFSGSGITSGSSNTLLGARIGAENLLPSDLSNNIIIADGEGTQRIRVLANGNTGIGTETPKSRLDISGYARLGAADVNADALTTASDRAGMIRYNTSNQLQYHNQTNWITLADAATVARADTTNDSWKDDAANKQVYLQYKADGTTARPSDSTVVIKDNGYTGIGLTSPAGILDIKGRMYVNNKQTIYHADALNTNFTGSLFIGNGGSSLSYTTGNEGKYNTGVGIDALTAITTGSSNTATGVSALQRNTTGTNNTATGVASLWYNTTGLWNTALGTAALRGNTTGSYNTAVGGYAMLNITPGSMTGSNNTAVGYQSLENITSGNNNTVLGYHTGSGLTTGANNTILGANVIGLSSALSNNIILADGQGVQRLRVLANGNTGIGTTTPLSRLHISGYAKLGTSDANADTLSTASDRAGMIRYNATSKTLQYHNDTQWITAASTAASDTTNDAWANDNANTMVKLNTLSDGTTARTAGTEVVIKDDGKVGIGTASPLWQLDVQGPSAIGHFKRFTGAAADNVAPTVLLARARGSVAAPSDIIAGDYLGKLQFRGRTGGTDTDYGIMTYIASSTTASDGRFAFFRGAGGNGNELVSINTNTGNVGIGTTTPSATLEVNGTVEISTVNNIGNDIDYKPLVWNTSTQRVETSANLNNVNKTTSSIAAGATASLGTLTNGSAYEVKIYVETDCQGTFYNKFVVTGGTLNNNWVLNYIGGMSQNGAPTTTTGTNKTTAVMLNPYQGGCVGDNTTSFNYTLSVGAGTGTLSITNNGNVARTYRVIWKECLISLEDKRTSPLLVVSLAIIAELSSQKYSCWYNS